MLLLRLLPLSLFVQSYKLQTTNFRYYAIGLSMMAAFSYGYLAGFSLPTVRALVMLSFYWLIRLLALNISVTRWLLLTLFIITLTTPFSLFTASFWLSVYAVTVIFLTLWRFKNILNTGHIFWRFIKGLIVIQLSLTVMLLPISAVFFQQVTLVALFANIIAVPWMSFISYSFVFIVSTYDACFRHFVSLFGSIIFSISRGYLELSNLFIHYIVGGYSIVIN